MFGDVCVFVLSLYEGLLENSVSIYRIMEHQEDCIYLHRKLGTRQDLMLMFKYNGSQKSGFILMRIIMKVIIISTLRDFFKEK